jgi:hypothetical protein
MNESGPRSNSDLKRLTVGLVGLVILFHIALALKGCGLFRDQHLGAALHYAATRIDFQHSIIPGMNATDTPTLLELPVWQAAAALCFKIFGTWWGWGNVVSLILFLPCLYPLFRIGRRYYGERAAWWTMVVFLCEALVFRYAGEAGTDGFSLAVTIWFWFACIQLLDQPSKWFLLAVVLGSLSATAKLPFFMAAGLGAFFLLLYTHGLDWRRLSVLGAVGAISGIVFFSWAHYTDKLLSLAVYPYVDLRLGGTTMGGPTAIQWYFGDMHYRLNPGNWIRGGWRFSNEVFGCFALMFFFAGALASRRSHVAAKCLLGGCVLTTLVFTHLVLHHHHYYLMFCPAVALLVASALAGSEQFLVRGGIASRLVFSGAAGLLLAGLLQGAMASKLLSIDPYPERIASIIRTHTTPQDKLVVINGGWGEELMRAGRAGLSATGANVFEDPVELEQLKRLGYNRLVILSQSPFQNAVQIINPGQTGMPRGMARDSVTPRTANWPTVFANDDIIIKEIPQKESDSKPTDHAKP